MRVIHSAAHVALVGLAIAIRVLAGLDDGLLRRAENLATGVVVALRLLENLLVTGASDDASLNACHVSSPHLACGSSCSIRTEILLRHHARRAQLTLTLARLLGEDVTTMGLGSLEPFGSLAKTLRRCPVGLQLGHNNSELA